MNRFRVRSHLIVLVLLVLSMAECNNSKKIKDNKKTIADTSRSQSADIYSLIVSFYSPGNGIDRAIKTEYVNFLNSNYPNIKYEKIKWGKEGEIDFCFKLDELDDNKKEWFINETNELLTKSNKIHIFEDTACKHKSN